MDATALASGRCPLECGAVGTTLLAPHSSGVHPHTHWRALSLARACACAADSRVRASAHVRVDLGEAGAGAGLRRLLVPLVVVRHRPAAEHVPHRRAGPQQVRDGKLEGVAADLRAGARPRATELLGAPITPHSRVPHGDTLRAHGRVARASVADTPPRRMLRSQRQSYPPHIRCAEMLESAPSAGPGNAAMRLSVANTPRCLHAPKSRGFRAIHGRHAQCR